MRGSSLRLIAFFLAVATLALGQVGNGTITGTVTDPAMAVIPGAAVEAKNTNTGVVYRGATTAAGNYTIPDLPVGTYTVTVTVTGFKTYTHTNIAVNATQVVREDVPLQVGATSETVNVTAESSLLKTDTGELGTNINLGQLDDLPLMGIGTVNAGTSGFRNPYNTLLTLPGVSSYNSSGLFVLNGLGGAFALTETMRIEGQDATSRIFGSYDYTQMAQPSVDAIQEISYQTSNYSAEYGQAGIAVINMTMKSGTNTYHGSGFDYFVNEDLNAGDPFSISGGKGSIQGGSGGKYRPRNRRNDFGGTLGGPIVIPKIYNGHNRTFWFFNYEQYAESTQYSFLDTVPTSDYLGGNFSHISPNGDCSLCSAYGIPTTALGGTQVDAMGRQMFANTIYDPGSRGVVLSTNLGYATPFQNNMIPPTSFDPISVKIQKLFPPATTSSLTGNYSGNIQGGRYSDIPAVKIDHNLDAKDKLSFYYSETNTESQISSPLGDADGLPTTIGGYRGTFVRTYTERLNYDRTITPTLLLHLGAGYYHTSFSDKAPFLSFNPSTYGLSGFINNRQFPSITGMCVAGAGIIAVIGCAGSYGGMQNIGTFGQIQTLNYDEKPSFVANTTWVHGKHTYKAGAELYLEGIISNTFSGVSLTTGNGPTAQPFTPTNSFNGYTQGFGYASFLLGDYTATNQTAFTDPKEGTQQWGLYVQDSWKVTRKLTVDYGLRWDLATPEHEQYGRLAQLDPTLANTSAGGHPGALQFANGCNCSFYKSAYPYAIGPRLGIAYQLSPKTVLRGGWGVNYQFVANPAGAIVSSNGIYPLAPIANNAQYVNIETPGAIVQPHWPVTNPFQYPNVGTTSPAPTVPDANENRPPRINQWSVGIQREITRSFVLEAEYVGNHSAWLPGGLGRLSQIPASLYAQYGLFPYPGTGPAGYSYAPAGVSCTAGNDCDRAILGQPISSTTVVQKLAAAGASSILPYTSFPTGSTLSSALYPYPQFGNLAITGSPTGNSKYDSLQIKATKRFSHNFSAGGAYTRGQGFTRATRQDFFNPQSAVWALQQIPPQTLTFNATYTTPKWGAFEKAKFVNQIVKDWQIAWSSNYQSGTFLAPPISTANAEFLPSEDTRVAGQSLYTQGVNLNNLSTYNPYTTQVLNPNAWKACPINSTCPAAANGPFGATATVLYKDFRAPRIPNENASLGRNFRIKERMSLHIRGEFVNIFNRTLMPAPSTINPQNAIAHGGAAGQLTSGFGVINAYLTPNTAYGTAPFLQGRTGTIVARFTF